LLHEHECVFDEDLGLEFVFQLIPAPLAHQTWLRWRLSYFSYDESAYFIALLIPQVYSNLKPHKIFKPKTTEKIADRKKAPEGAGCLFGTFRGIKPLILFQRFCKKILKGS
jgi:hypothetical protein